LAQGQNLDYTSRW